MAASMYLSLRGTDLLVNFKTSAWLRILQTVPLPSCLYR
jgi:hypothetical protein